MKNWFIMLGIDILIPLLMMLFGWLLEHKTPKKMPYMVTGQVCQ